MNLETEIKAIKDRNQRVEAYKAWEISGTRRLLIVVLTYCVVVLFFVVMKLPKPFINALVPSLGFLLSTLSVQVVKKVWVKVWNKRN